MLDARIAPEQKRLAAQALIRMPAGARSALSMGTPQPTPHDGDGASARLTLPFPQVLWQCFLGETGKWSDYHPEDCRKIEKAFEAGASRVWLGWGDEDERWEIDFGSMLQKTCWSGRCRMVRRLLITHAG